MADFIKINPANITQGTRDNPIEIKALQVAIYVMAGGGMIGRFAAEQPADYYHDTRTGQGAYSNRAVQQAVDVLARLAELNGLNPHKMARVPNFHYCGIF